MKPFSLLAIVAASASLILTVGAETNAERFARGQPPLAPVRRSSSSLAARGPAPSPTHCIKLCCDQVTSCGAQSVKDLELKLNLQGLSSKPDELCGVGCDLRQGKSCHHHQTKACCKSDFDDHFFGKDCTADTGHSGDR